MRTKSNKVAWKKALFCTSLALTSMSVHAHDGRVWAADKSGMPSSVAQDQVTITGSVSDNMGPMIGVTVLEKGTTNGCVTDLNGQFVLKVKSADATLIVSNIGYTTQEVKLRGRKSVTITLAEDNKLLNEVVVVGYGTQKKVNMTGAVSSINVSKLAESRPLTNVSQALAGLAAGVSVTSNHNRPGDDNASILVRGQGTLNSSAPLIIIDGSEAGINTVNPQDIESISILKDAASAAIYVMFLSSRFARQ